MQNIFWAGLCQVACNNVFSPVKDVQESQTCERFKAYTYEELIQCDKANLDITGIKDTSLIELEKLPEPKYS